MEFTGKKVLLGMVYYTLIALNVAIAISFMIFLSVSGASLFSKISYFILISLLVLLIVYDIVCTNLGRMKFISGLILYVLCVITAIMTFVLYGLTAVNGLIPAGVGMIYYSLVALSFSMAILDIVIFTVGEKMIEFDTTK